MSAPSAGQPFDHLFKIVLVGDSGVGKSNLLSRFTRDNFSTDEKSTIGVEFATRIVTVASGKRVKAQIWDTAGQERYRAITTAYYRGALGALLVYDVTRQASLANIPRWLTELRSHAHRDIVLLMVGNKTDLCQSTGGADAAGDDTASPVGGSAIREVSTEAAQAMARDLGIPCVETSAKTGEGVDGAFTSVIQRIFEASQLGTSAARPGSSGGAGGGSATTAASSFAPHDDATEPQSSVQLGGSAPKQDKKCC